MWFKKLVKGMNPWLPVFAVNILFQFQRRSPVDGIIFSVAALLMILDWKALLPIHFGPRPVFRLRWIILAIALCATVLYFAPRHSVQDMWVLLSVIPIAVLAVYYRDRIHNSEDFPTISFLVSPTLEFGWVRFVFLVIWLSMGVGLMQIMRGGKVIKAIEHDADVTRAARDAQVSFESKKSFKDEVQS